MNRLSLYELSANYLQALDFLTDPEMDLPIEAVNDTLEALGGELEDKAINVAKFFRNMEATAEAIKSKRVAVPPMKKYSPTAFCDFLIGENNGGYNEMASAY